MEKNIWNSIGILKLMGFRVFFGIFWRVDLCKGFRGNSIIDKLKEKF